MSSNPDSPSFPSVYAFAFALRILPATSRIAGVGDVIAIVPGMANALPATFAGVTSAVLLFFGHDYIIVRVKDAIAGMSIPIVL